MTDDVKRCVDMRVNYFNQYFSIPSEMQYEVQNFITDITALAEQCTNATEYENQFQALGYSERFNAIIPRLIPIPRTLTKQDRKRIRQTTKEMIVENRNEILKDAAKDIAGHAYNELNSEILRQNRERMIADDTYDDYTRARNKVGLLHSIVDFFRKK